MLLMVARGAGSEEPSAPEGPATIHDASVALKEILSFFYANPSSTRDLDGLLAYIPDEVLDSAIAVRKSRIQQQSQQQQQQQQAQTQAQQQEPSLSISFEEIVQVIRASDSQQIVGASGGGGGSVPSASGSLHLDSYAERLLVWGQPSQPPTVLSSFMVSPTRSVHRVEVVSPSGECSVLTFVLGLEESLQPQYRSLCVARSWRLRSVAGEPGPSEEPPACADPTISPELVVHAQLVALQRREVDTVFNFASPDNKALTGPLQRFRQLLESPAYKPLLAHSRSESLRRVSMSSDKYIEIVAVQSKNTGFGQDRAVSLIYIWELALQKPSAEEGANCWMTQSVQLVSGGQLIRWDDQ